MITFNDSVIGALEFTVSWEKDGISHVEWFLGRKLNPVNDIFPRGMREALEGKKAGESVAFTYEPRMCIPRFKETLVELHPLRNLRPKTFQGRPIIPQIGRFYPQGFIFYKRDNNSDNLTPFRLTNTDDTNFSADCNHPLANVPVTIEAKIQYLEKRETGTFGSLTHWREKTCDWGPGMQAQHDGQPTDFFHDAFFDRRDAIDTPFTPPTVDATAHDNFKKLFAQFLKPKMRVLDLSATLSIPPKGKYDAALCTLSIEYMPDPITTLKAVKDHLKPGGIILIGFTNHYDKNHVIQGWIDLHEFERMGLVMDYLRQAELDTNAGTISKRNDWRPQDDPHFIETRGVSDPVYVVYGHKS